MSKVRPLATSLASLSASSFPSIPSCTDALQGIDPEPALHFTRIADADLTVVARKEATMDVSKDMI